MNRVRKVCCPLWLLLLATVLLPLKPVLAQDPEGPDSSVDMELGHPGYLIVGSARDSLAGYAWERGPGPGQISLRWAGGLLSIPDSLALESFAEWDLAVPVLATLAGAGESGSLRWRDGRYDISEPLLLADGRISFLVSAGELEIKGTRVRYRPADREAAKDRGNMKASLLMMAGFALLIWVLLRRARRKIKEIS